MRPKPIRTRADLISAILNHCPTRACERAVREGRAVVLGGFTPPGDFPQWIVKVESRHGHCWYVAVVCDETNYQFHPKWYGASEVPWAHWDGCSNGSRLVDGEQPRVSALRRAMARRKQSE